MHQKIDPQRMKYAYILSFFFKSEYQFEKKLIKHVAFSALSKNVSPLFNDNPQGGRGLREKITQVFLRRKVMLRYDLQQ